MSRIRVRLTQGSVVTTLKNTVDLAERARVLVAIAHPEHGDGLEAEARATGSWGGW